MGVIKKMFGLQTELVKLDLKEILDNYRKPKFWKKKWVVFRHKEFDVVFSIYYINIENNTITCACKIANFKRKGVYIWSLPSYWCSSIPIDNPDYKQENFNRTILAGVVGVIDMLEKSIVEKSYEYKEAEKLDARKREILRQVAEDFLDSENVKNEDIREVYIESYVDKNAHNTYTRDLLANAIRRYYPTARLLANSWFDYKKGFEEEAKIVREKTKKTKKLIYEIWKARKEIEGEEYLKEAQEKLESI